MDIVSSAFFSKPASAEDHCGRQSPVMDMPVIIMAFLLLLLGIFAILYADSFQNLASALALGV